jgi:hypothetical protein
VAVPEDPPAAPPRGARSPPACGGGWSFRSRWRRPGRGPCRRGR